MQVFVYEVVRFTTVTNMITNSSNSTDYWLFLMGGYLCHDKFNGVAVFDGNKSCVSFNRSECCLRYVNT